MSGSFPERVPQPRNLAIFWAATLEGRSQTELAAEHGVSQQRVSQIIGSTRQFIALASSQQYDGVPQPAQLQLGCRIQLEKLKRRRRAMAVAYEESTKPLVSVKKLSGAKCGERTETVEKSRYGDWRIDRQLGEIDKQMLETQMLLYERPWWGKERMRNAESGMRNEEREGIRNSEFGMRNDGAMEAVVEGFGVMDGAVVVAEVHGTEFSVLSTDLSIVAEVASTDLPAVEAEMDSLASVPASAIRNLQSAIEESAIEEPAVESQPLVDHAAPAPRLWRKDPICDLSGRWINGPSAAHRPWRRVSREWLKRNPAATGYTPEGVLWKRVQPPPIEASASDDVSDSSPYVDSSCDVKHDDEVELWEACEMAAAP